MQNKNTETKHNTTETSIAVNKSDVYLDKHLPLVGRVRQRELHLAGGMGRNRTQAVLGGRHREANGAVVPAGRTHHRRHHHRFGRRQRLGLRPVAAVRERRGGTGRAGRADRGRLGVRLENLWRWRFGVRILTFVTYFFLGYVYLWQIGHAFRRAERSLHREFIRPVPRPEDVGHVFGVPLLLVDDLPVVLDRSLVMLLVERPNSLKVVPDVVVRFRQRTLSRWLCRLGWLRLTVFYVQTVGFGDGSGGHADRVQL